MRWNDNRRGGGQGRVDRRSSQKLLPDRLELRPRLLGPKAKVAHLVNTVRPDVLKEAPHELLAWQPHRSPLEPVAAAIAEDDLVVGHLHDAVVAQRPAMERTPEVAEHCVGAVLGLLRVDLPVGVEHAVRELESLDGARHHRAELVSKRLGQYAFGR